MDTKSTGKNKASISKTDKDMALIMAAPVHAAMTNGGRLASSLRWQKIDKNSKNEYGKK